MTQRKLSSYLATILMFVLAGCGQSQTPTATPLSSSTPTISPSPTPDPTETLTPVPTASSAGAGPFQRVTSVTDQLPQLYNYMDAQLRAPADGSVWVIASQAAGRWNGQTWDFVYPLEENMLADVDESGRLWVFHQDADGIDAWQNGQWTTYGAESGWTSAHVTTPWQVSAAEDGAVWLPTDEDVRHFDGKRWTIHSLKEMGFPAVQAEDEWIVHRIALPYGGEQIWVGECYESGPGPVGGAGVRWFAKKTWRGADAPMGPDCVTVVQSDSEGNVWVGVREAVWRYDPAHQRWMSFPVPDTRQLEQYNFTYPLDLIVDASGDIWVHLQYCGGASCDTGHSRIYRIHNGQWSQMLDAQEYSMLLQQLALDGNGQTWLFWNGTIYRLAGDKATSVTELPVLAANVSPDGKVWILTSYENDNALWVLEP